MPPPSSAPRTTAPVTFAQALRYWFKLGWISFGGPAGQIALMHAELVERRRWISERRFLHALNYCMLLPGPEAQQLATYLGWLMHRTAGGLAAGVFFVLPGVLVLVTLSWVYCAWGHLPWVAALFYGIKPAVTAIVAQAAQRIGARTLHNAALWAVALGAFVCIFFLHLPFPLIVIGAGALGVLGGRLAPRRFQTRAADTAETPSAPALFDDDTVVAHALVRPARLLRTLLIGLGLWAAPMALLAWGLGPQHLLTQMGWFFSKMALVTFGGAYAALPYVYQNAVAHHGWLTAGQMIDGLGLGETTPGPLILVTTFVGFVGGYTHAVLGAHAPLAAGIAAAAVVTWFTFLPSFVFVFAGAPFIEATHGEQRFIAPLTAITAAVVGVILNLALFFAWHVFWPAGLHAAPDWRALTIALGAALALMRWRRGVIEVVAASALAGWLLSGFAA